MPSRPKNTGIWGGSLNTNIILPVEHLLCDNQKENCLLQKREKTKRQRERDLRFET